jgi:hypothetical protein
VALSIKLVASEFLMCGLKKLPFVGTAFEVVEGVRSRRELFADRERLDKTIVQMTRLEKGLRDQVEKEIRTVLDELSRPKLDGPTLTQEIRNLQGIRAQGWEPSLFEGLLANSSHWQEIHRNPQNYGRLLSDQDAVNPESIHMLIDSDSICVLELTPYAFSQLLAEQAVGAPKAKVESAQDVWAIREASIFPPLDVPVFTPWPRTPRIMNGASQRRVKLNRVSGISDGDWALLKPLWFWLVNSRDITHTFGYVQRELPDRLRDPLARWIDLAKGQRGKGSEVRDTLVGQVVRVNVKAESIEILDSDVVV